MFDNVGGKIKAFAQVLCWIGIICSVISGFVMMENDEDLAFLGFIIIVAGSLVSWLSSLTLYGFGQLIENTNELVLNTEKTKRVTETTDLELILEDQRDLYSPDEIFFIEKELASRTDRI